MLGVEMHEREGAYGGVQVVFRAPLWQLLGSPRYALYYVTTPAAPGLFLPAGPDDRWVYGPTLPAEDAQPADLEPAGLVEAIRAGAGVGDLDLRIERIGPFHSPGELADRFRVGRTFLAGDAAHRVTPRGGTGMNTALQSGYDIGWKLAWVLQSWADPSLLDTYEAERRVVAEHNVDRSTDPNGSRRPVLDELSVDIGGRVAHAWVTSTSGQVSTLDLLGPGWTLFTGPSRAAWDAVGLPSGAPLTVEALDAVTARALGLRGDGALLARPDGVPVARLGVGGGGPRPAPAAGAAASRRDARPRGGLSSASSRHDRGARLRLEQHRAQLRTLVQLVDATEALGEPVRAAVQCTGDALRLALERGRVGRRQRSRVGARLGEDALGAPRARSRTWSRSSARSECPALPRARATTAHHRSPTPSARGMTSLATWLAVRSVIPPSAVCMFLLPAEIALCHCVSVVQNFLAQVFAGTVLAPAGPCTARTTSATIATDAKPRDGVLLTCAHLSSSDRARRRRRPPRQRPRSLHRVVHRAHR